MKRRLELFLLKDLRKKMVLLSGPRQVGKTSLSQNLVKESEYYNFDVLQDRKILLNQEWTKKSELLIFDEIHKMKAWKTWLKGVYDAQKTTPPLLVTGSARLEVYRKGGDSLAGRYFGYRLHPFTVSELREQMPAEKVLKRLLEAGGFPEPFLAKNVSDVRRWRNSHLYTILREDLLSLEKIREISLMETLVLLLQDRVGSTVSYQSLAKDLQVSSHTVKHWLDILERLYIIYKVPPYSTQIARSLLKESKYYFYDVGCTQDPASARLENVVASALLSEIHFLEDTQGIQGKLFFLKNRDGLEVDFLVALNRKPALLVEVKWADEAFSKNLFHFKNQLKAPLVPVIQVVYKTTRAREKEGVSLLPAVSFLKNLPEIFTSCVKFLK